MNLTGVRFSANVRGGHTPFDSVSRLHVDSVTTIPNHDTGGEPEPLSGIRWQPHAVGGILFALTIGVLRFVIGWIAVRRQGGTESPVNRGIGCGTLSESE
ncbi:MAG: hypothetical protein R3B91_01710 [Planctomycetaceae bacterium]